MNYWLIISSIGLLGCASRLDRDEENAYKRAEQIISACAINESCAQMSDDTVKGYSNCTNSNLKRLDFISLNDGRAIVHLSCDIGDGFLFQVVMDGASGPAFEQVHRCANGTCPVPSQVFEPVA